MPTTLDATLDDRLAALFASDPVALADPFSLYRELREAGPVHQHGPLVLVTGYADCKALYRDAARFSSAAYRHGTMADASRARLTPEQLDALEELNRLDTMRMSATDGAVHERLRAIAHRAFTPGRIRQLEQNAQRYLDELLAEQSGPVVDLMEVAYQLPLMLIADLLGVPLADRERIHAWSDVIGRNRGGLEPEPILPAYAAVKEFAAYVAEIVRRHRGREAPTDLVAALMGAEHEERMNVEEVVVTYMMLLFAGHETTTNLISIGLLELLRRPEQWRVLVDDPSLAPNATEELLRFVTPVQWNNRVALEDMEVAGHPVVAGQSVRMLTASANRDPAQFEHGEELDLMRPNARDHLALGFGEHFCLGNALARLEGRLAFATLAERFPGLRLVEEPEWTGAATLRKLARLPVALS